MNELHQQAPHVRAHELAAAALLAGVGRLLESAGEPRLVQQQPWAESNFGGLNPARILNPTEPGPASVDGLDRQLLAHAERLAGGDEHVDSPAADQPADGLVPILSQLGWPEPNRIPAQPGRLPTVSLSFAGEHFLPGGVSDRAAYTAACRELAEPLLAGLQGDFDGPSQCIDGLLGLTERLGHAVPADWASGVSLFDRSRIAAAFAGCLAVLYEQPPEDGSAIQGRYRLLGLSLGGIQRFILRAGPPLEAGPGATGEKGMARRLRARSFYVGLLTWLAARRVLDGSGLPSVHLLINAGGRAVLLLPDHPGVLDRTRQNLASIRQWFLERLGGMLRLDVALTAPLTDEAFAPENFPTTFRRFDQRLGQARLVGPADELRTPAGWREDGWIDAEVSLPIDRRQFDQLIQQLGRQIPRAEYLSLDDPERHSGDIELLGYRVRLTDQRPPAGTPFALTVRPHDSSTTPLAVTANHVPTASPEDLEWLEAYQGERPPADENAPRAVGDLLTFVDLAYLATDDRGERVPHPMLAALKADVDRLGMLLGYGLGRRASFGRIAALARSLDLFFKGFLSEQLRAAFPRVYTVFAGGDDLFLIGPWYDLVRFIEQLQGWFAQATAGNDNITFSAGLVFSKPTVPVSHLAEAAEHALEQSKDQGRGRITVGSATMLWSDFHRAAELHRLMLAVAREPAGSERRGLNSSLVNRLLQYGRMAQRARGSERPNPTDLKWRAQLSYDLKRNLPLDRRPRGEPPSGESSARRPLDPREQLHCELSQVHTLDDAAVLQAAAMFTLYLLRGEAL